MLPERADTTFVRGVNQYMILSIIVLMLAWVEIDWKLLGDALLAQSVVALVASQTGSLSMRADDA